MEYSRDNVQTEVRNFAISKVAPVADKLDQAGEFPMDNFRAMAEMGLFGLGIPTQYGGSGGDITTRLLAIEEIARACVSTAATLRSQNASAVRIYRYGTEEQRKTFLPPLIKGEKIYASAITEADAGSDVANIQTTAVKDGESYILNGTKVFVVRGAVCNLVNVLAKIPALGSRAMGMFIVEDSADGFIRGRKYNSLGFRAAVSSELIFKDCRIPAANQLGKEGEGFSTAMTLFDEVRMGAAVEAVGITQAILDRVIDYSKQRTAFGRPISKNQAIAWMLADMATQLEAARLLTYEAASRADKGLPFSKQAAMAKLYASEICMKAATQGIQIFGGYGYMVDAPMQRYFRDAKAITIYDGTSEIQRLVISRALLK